MKPIVIKIKDLSKNYGKNLIFDNTSIVISNEYLNLITGINGSGKTTLVKILLNLTKYTGHVFLSSSKVSFSPNTLSLPDSLTINEFINHLLKIRKNVLFTQAELTKGFSLTSEINKEFVNISTGTKHKTLLMQALLDQADIFIFDEPLNGLDNKSQGFFLKCLERLLLNEKLVIIITHRVQKYISFSKNIIKIRNKKLC